MAGILHALRRCAAPCITGLPKRGIEELWKVCAVLDDPLTDRRHSSRERSSSSSTAARHQQQHSSSGTSAQHSLSSLRECLLRISGSVSAGYGKGDPRSDRRRVACAAASSEII
ncbi:hypothetical protein Esti_005368 [Eimeria stiedai]